MNFTEDQQKIVDMLEPAIEIFIRKVNKASDALCFTGFIYGSNPPIILHVGNIHNQGEELVEIHYCLAMMAAQLHATGQFKAAKISEAPEGSTSEELADKLALSLMAVPLGEHSDSIKDLLHQYIQSRRPEKT